MKVFSNYKKFLLSFLILLLITIIYTILLFYNILNINSLSSKIIPLIIGLATFFFLTLFFTSSITKKGWLKGIIIGLLFLITPIIYRFFNNTLFHFSILIKYLSYLLISSLAGIINVNKNKEK